MRVGRVLPRLYVAASVGRDLQQACDDDWVSVIWIGRSSSSVILLLIAAFVAFPVRAARVRIQPGRVVDLEKGEEKKKTIG